MKIALVYGGQPRFTPDFLDLMSQLKGFEFADIYMCLWQTEWANNNETAERKISKILTGNYRIGKIKIADEPNYKLPPHTSELSEDIHFWGKRGYAQTNGLNMAFNLIDDEYDAIIRFRADGRLDRTINLNDFNLDDDSLITPNGPISGHNGYMINDQFAIGNQESMKFYCSLSKEYEELIIESQPSWETTPVGWTLDYLYGTYYKKYNKKFSYGDFQYIINNYGRSKYTDKHYHHRIAPDPTE